MPTPRKCLALTMLLVTCFARARANAGDPASLDRCDPDTASRIRFIEERLDQRRTYADYWWKGWTSTYAIGTVVESVQAGRESRQGRRADYAVGAAKAAFGTTRLLLFPPTARTGADAMRAIDPVDAGACHERLVVGEDLLHKNAEETASRWSWKRHLANFAINAAGGVIVAEGFDESRGWASAGIGFAVGEAMTLSHPWKADDDLDDYEQRFSTTQRRVSWSVAPFFGGARVLVKF